MSSILKEVAKVGDGSRKGTRMTEDRLRIAAKESHYLASTATAEWLRSLDADAFAVAAGKINQMEEDVRAVVALAEAEVTRRKTAKEPAKA